MDNDALKRTGDAACMSSEVFTATHWTQVLMAAREDGSAESSRAMEALFGRYWPALYAFMRRRGYSPADAEDLTQGFFAEMVQDHSLARADRNKGKFRSFLLGSLERFLVDQARMRGAEKRGYHRVVHAFDFASAEQSYLDEVDPAMSPEQAFDRRWATSLLDAAYLRVQEEFESAGQADRFRQLKRFIVEDAEENDYRVIAATLGLTAKSVSSAVCRLRDRYRACVRRLVLDTAGSEEDIDSEFETLFR